jgi:hypothetical protein
MDTVIQKLLRLSLESGRFITASDEKSAAHMALQTEGRHLGFGWIRCFVFLSGRCGGTKHPSQLGPGKTQ